MRPLRPLLALVLLLSGCLGGGEVPAADAAGYVPVAGFADVHGLAVDPADPGTVYVATHRGLVRGQGGAWARVGAMQDDLMGFSMHPADGRVLWASGHPKDATPGFVNLGVRQSRDRGFTWEALALPGVDFHAMAVSPADPDRLWGAYRGQLHRSEDGGRSWSVVNASASGFAALAPHPKEADVLFAVTPGVLLRSADGGATWSAHAQVAVLGLAIDPADARVMYAGARGAILKSADGGLTWARTGFEGDEAIAHLAVAAKDPRVVVAAGLRTGIHRSEDGGATWTTLKAPAA